MNDNDQKFKELLKVCNPTLYKVDQFIDSMGKMGWGQVDIKIKVRNYVNVDVEMIARDHKDDNKSFYGKKIETKIDKK